MTIAIVESNNMNTINDIVLEIEFIKLLQSLDYKGIYTSKYEGEKEALFMILKPLLKQSSET